MLARQLLLMREQLTVPEALERVGGLQAQYAPSMYIGLWSRMKDFEREDLDRALDERLVVQGTLMRATIHLVSVGDYWPFAIGIRRGRRSWWLKVRPEHPTAVDMQAAARLIRRRLKMGPLRRSEIDELLGKGSALTNGVGLWLDMVRIPPSGTWEHRRADLFAAAEEWIGPPHVTQAEGIRHIVRRYLGGFGPAVPKDVADWAGLPVTSIAAATRHMRLSRYLDEAGQELIDLPGAPLPDPETPAPVRFLPTWDATLLAHVRNKGFLPEEYRTSVFNTKTPHSVPTFLVDGAVAGSWRYEKGRVRLDEFHPLDKKTRAELRQEGERLAMLHSSASPSD